MFFGSVHRVLPVLVALAGGLRHDRPEERSRQRLRDQASSILAEAGSLAGPTTAGANLDSGACRGEPVSYTHLTLPTICSV
eukprot:2918331-Alexandrium_andersonii.AAC.1